MLRFHRRVRVSAAAVTTLSLVLIAGTAGADAQNPHATPPGLPLGPAGLTQTRTDQAVVPGVTLSTIVRGTVSAQDAWTVTIGVPTSGVTPPDPDPDAPTAVLGSQQTAAGVAAQLLAAGWTARVEAVASPGYTDLPAGVIGYQVRVGSSPTQAAANTLAAALKAKNFKPSVVFTGQDGTATTGPWVVHVLTIDPHLFTGTLAESHGAALTGRNTTSLIAAHDGAIAAVNGGFFIINPADGVPGGSAGIVVEHGRVLHDATNGRVTALIRDGGRSVEFRKLTTDLQLRDDSGAVHKIEGLNRVPGLIRDCGGDVGDTPTARPLHDITCTDPDEISVLTPEFGAPPPAGPGVEAVLDPTGQVVQVRPRTGAPVPAGDQIVQAIDTEAAWLTAHAVPGTHLRLETHVTDERGHTVHFGPNDSAVNGGPLLVARGQDAIAPVADGVSHPGDPSFFYGWGIRRNPRTMIGTTRDGKILLVEVDGRQAAYSQGLSLVEGAHVMESLGAVEAMNLDGGGSSAMVVNGTLASSPSDATGERPVGDAVVVTTVPRKG